jgi:hypothetical protein
MDNPYDDVVGTSPTPYVRYRNGKLIIISSGNYHKWSSGPLSVLPRRYLFHASLILRAEFQFCNDDCPTIADFYEFSRDLRQCGDRLLFRVEKARNPEALRPFQHPNPYTDDHQILLDFDDMMTVFLSV